MAAAKSFPSHTQGKHMSHLFSGRTGSRTTPSCPFSCHPWPGAALLFMPTPQHKNKTGEEFCAMILSSCKSPTCFPFPLSRPPTRRSSSLTSAILRFLVPWRVILFYHIANPQPDRHCSLFSCSCSQHWALGETDMTVPPGPPRTYELQCLQSWARTSSVCLSLSLCSVLLPHSCVTEKRRVYSVGETP